MDQASQELLDGLFRQWSALWMPRPRLSLSEWAEKNFHLSPEYSSTTGLIRLFGWQREIFDSFTDPRVSKIVLKVGTQLVKTLFIQSALAYVMAEAPGPMLLSQPKDADAETFSKERLGPMLRDNECLKGKVPAHSRSPLNTTLYKAFPGGSLTLVGSLVPGNAARRSIQYYFGDEINKYPPSAGNEGSFIRLAEERVVTFGTRSKIIYACSPTEHWAPITREYAFSDQRQPWVPCPRCGFHQVLKWPQVWWSKDVPLEQQPSTACYRCENCSALWNDNDRWRAVEASEWRPQKPFMGTAGFWISHLYSPHKKLERAVRQWMDAQATRDTNDLRVFVNTTLAEEWVDRGEAPEHEMIWRRRDNYEIGTVPMRGLFLTAFVDVQDESLHVEVVAWGRGKENWSVWYEVIQCQTKDGHMIKTSSPEPWRELDKLLAREWPHESGESLPIRCMGIDIGFRSEQVYEFARHHPRPHHDDVKGTAINLDRVVVPTRGNDDAIKLISTITTEDASRKRRGIRIWTIGTHKAKQEFYDALRLLMPDDEQQPQPNRCHYPYPEREFYRQLTSETRTVRASGKVDWVKDPAIRNEPLDTHVGNMAMAELCRVNTSAESYWQPLEERVRPSVVPREILPAPVESAAIAPAAIRKQPGWLGDRQGSWFNR